MTGVQTCALPIYCPVTRNVKKRCPTCLQATRKVPLSLLIGEKAAIRNEIPSPEKPGYPARLFAYLDMWKKMENKEKKVNNRYTGVLHI